MAKSRYLLNSLLFTLALLAGITACRGGATTHTDDPALPADVSLTEMVKVPAGPFTMGAWGEGIPAGFGPTREINLPAFLMDKYAVTNQAYKHYLDTTHTPPPPHWKNGTFPAGKAYHPVVNVSQPEAAAFAAWQGKRLPTEAEWEKAARGADARVFQWGNQWDPEKCNSAERDYFTMETSPVYAHRDIESPFGCVQLTGNVWEWCSERVKKAPYKNGDTKDPQVLLPDGWGVSRGGSWTTIWQGCRTFSRCLSVWGGRYGYTGFRCVRDYLPPAELKPPGLEGMVLIPAGEFIFGSPGPTQKDRLQPPCFRPDEVPQNKIYLDAFHIDRCCVTNQQYHRFILAVGHRPPPHWPRCRFPKGKGNYPVVNVSRDDAIAYATWAGKRLPTEAEWEKAARGTDGRIYPWGNEYKPNQVNGINNGVFRSMPVDSYPEGASVYGCLQMSGNVWEWVADYYDPEQYKHLKKRNPKGPKHGQFSILRGGTWSSTKFVLTTTARCRAIKGCHWSYTGFRCAK